MEAESLLLVICHLSFVICWASFDRFVRSFVRSFARQFVRSFVRSFRTLFHCSTAPLFHYSTTWSRAVTPRECSTAPLLHSFTVSLFHRSIVALVHCFTVPFFHCPTADRSSLEFNNYWVQFELTHAVECAFGWRVCCTACRNRMAPCIDSRRSGGDRLTNRSQVVAVDTQTRNPQSKSFRSH